MIKPDNFKQHAVHANGYTATYTYSQANLHTDYSKTVHNDNGGYNKYSDHHDHSDYGNWSDWSDTYRVGSYTETKYGARGGSYSRGGYYAYGNHIDSNPQQYSQNYSQANYTKETGRTQQNVVNRSPALSSSPTPNSGLLNRDVVVINWSGVGYSDDNTSSASKYRVYYSYCTTSNGTYGNWTQLSEQTGTSYSWTITNVAKGYYKIAITAYDGATWSALPSGNSWVAHHITNTTATTKIENTSYDTISYALGGPIKIVHYNPPSWLNEYYTAAAMNQLVQETKKARSAFDLSGYSFTNDNYIGNFTIITLQDFKELDAANNETYKLYKGSNYSFKSGVNTSGASNAQEIKNQAIIDIRDLLNHLKN